MPVPLLPAAGSLLVVVVTAAGAALATAPAATAPAATAPAPGAPAAPERAGPDLAAAALEPGGTARVLAPAARRDPVAPSPRWGWPLAGHPRVVRGFDPPPSPWLPGHRGVDLAAVPGDPVLAAGAGTVTFAGSLAGRGVVTVTHGELRTTYEPVVASVSVGDRVALGERLGVLGSGASHCGGLPPCLHWGLRRGETYLDPLLLLGTARPVLLPVPHGRG